MSAITMSTDLEDGEIEDSDGQEDVGQSCSTNTAPNPSVEELDQREFPMHSKPSVDRIYRSTHNPCMDSSASSSSDEDDLDLDDAPKKSKVKRTSSIPSGGPMDSANAHGDAFCQAAKGYQAAKSNKVWNAVVFDQTLDETLKKVNTVEKQAHEQDRGVESYNYASNRFDLVDYEDDFLGNLYGEDDKEEDSRGRGDRGDGDSVEMGDEIDRSPENEVEVNIGDIESFGTGPSVTKNRKRKLKDRLGKRPHRDDHSRSNSPTIKDRLGKRPESGDHSRSNSPTEKKQHVKSRLGKQGPWGPRPVTRNATFNLKSKEDDPPEKVAGDIAKALGEPEYQLELFFRVVSTLGVKKSLEIYYDTESIEEGGGMMILNGSRRRSPGGIFLHLVKTDKEVTNHDVKKIFPDNQQQKQRRRRDKKHGKNKNKNRAPEEVSSNMDSLPATEENTNAGDTMEVVAESSKTDPLNDSIGDLEDNCVDIELDLT